jgi:S1-C subfamily serine protease
MATAVKRLAAALVAASLGATSPGHAENQMGYQLLNAQQAAQLPRGGGSLGMDVGRGQVITDSGMTFELLKVQAVRRGSPAARAGFDVGDQVIAVDGRVFPSVVAFAEYVGSLPTGRTISVDYLPRGGGPEQAQRVGVTLGTAGGGVSAPRPPAEPSSHGLSAGQKLAIGVGAVALFGCYKVGCFTHRDQPQPRGAQQP